MYNPITKNDSPEGKIINIGYSKPGNECLRLIINEMMGSYGSPLYDKYELLIKENLTDEEEYIFFSVLMSDKSDFRLIDNPQSVGALKTIYGKLPDIWAEMENIYLNYI